MVDWLIGRFVSGLERREGEREDLRPLFLPERAGLLGVIEDAQMRLGIESVCALVC